MVSPSTADLLLPPSYQSERHVSVVITELSCELESRFPDRIIGGTKINMKLASKDQ